MVGRRAQTLLYRIKTDTLSHMQIGWLEEAAGWERKLDQTQRKLEIKNFERERDEEQ